MYRHSNPAAYAGYLRRLGFDAQAADGGVAVYHEIAVQPDEKRSPVSRILLSAVADPEGFVRALNAHIGFTLRTAGFVAVGRTARREYISAETHVVHLAAQERGRTRPTFPARAHLRCTWDIEHHSGRTWIVPLPGRCYLSSQDPNHPAVSKWLLSRVQGEPAKALDLSTGKHRSLAFGDGKWGQLYQGEWKPLEGAGWRVTINLEAAKDLGYSEKAYYAAQFTFDDLEKVFHGSSPFASLLLTLWPFEVPADRSGQVTGAHLRFARGSGKELREVLRLGVLAEPPQPVLLTVVASRKRSSGEDEVTRRFLNAHLAPSDSRHESRMQEALKSVGYKDTIATIWTKQRNGLSLKPFNVVKKMIHEYDPETGQLSEPGKLAGLAQQAHAERQTLIALVLLDDEIDKIRHDALMRQFRGLKALPLKSSSLTLRAGYPGWINLALTLSQKAGAIPWCLQMLPGVDDQTVFVGIDLGHDHRGDRSNLAITLVDHCGCPLDASVTRCPRNDERIAVDMVARELPRLIYHRTGLDPTQVIIHRDGRYLPGESEEIKDSLRNIPRLTLGCIKKDTNTRLAAAALEGTYFRLDEQRAIIVTNAQARHTSMPAPLEIELEEPGDQTLENVVTHVFWLTRVCQGSAYHPRRLPLTTEWANNIAETGRRVHLKGWETSEE
jgi:hypothetical protein